ncbi:MAG TPA: C39 family peptidase [Vicinamibacterales bacterium]|nr:C39 family peptidase [Vicinamibacterales bacterium]
MPPRAARSWRALVTAAVLSAAATICLPPCARAAAQSGPPAAAAVLDVPFVPQSEDLCGGAAAAMVMRYWGARDVHAATFAPLVDRSAGGIRTSALTAELQRRDWTATAGSGTSADLEQELGRGRPVIALIEDRPTRYHYVVVVGASSGKIILHDPARAPSRVVDARAFDEAWAKTDRWMLILLPAPGTSGRAASPAAGAGGFERPATVGACAVAVDESVQLADTDRTSARRALMDATRTCPADSAPWRELAGLDAVEGNWKAATLDARHAVSIDASDAHAWRVLATSEYLLRHDGEALDAWNRVGEPSLDLIDVKGLQATRYEVIAGAIDVAPGGLLTLSSLRRAERRVRDVPSVAIGRVGYHPLENGRAQIDASIVERSRAPVTYPSWIALGIDAAVDREMTAPFANPTGGGDLMALTWRWWTNRPMVGASYSAPAPRALGGGVWRVAASRERQTFGPALFKETRTRAALDLANWIDDRTRVSGGVALEQWTNRPRLPAFSGRVEFRPLADRLGIDAGGTTWVGTRGFGAFDAGAHWRSRQASEGIVWLMASGFRAATHDSPASVWPGADTGHARDVLLRAHPLLADGVIDSGVFGRRLGFVNVEVQRWRTAGAWPIRFAPAAFVDLARATHGLQDGITRPQLDAGAGLRISVPGMGVLRIDVARGLRDGRMALSAGVSR